jgi:hypothetical protein
MAALTNLLTILAREGRADGGGRGPGGAWGSLRQQARNCLVKGGVMR